MSEPPSYSSPISAISCHPISTTKQYQDFKASARNGHHNGRRTRDTFESTAKEKSSLDLTQRLEKKLAEYNASENIFKRWLFELVSWVVSALCMGAVVGIYIQLNGMTMARSETLLTLANIFGKVASAALIIPTSEALGQLKWNWFNNSNAIWDFELFDKASRGAWGAALLLFRTKGRSLAALGALLIVLLLAIDTFFQQVVVFPDRWTLHDTPGEIPRVVHYDPVYLEEFQGGFENRVYNTDTQPVIQQFLYGNGTQPVVFGTGVRAEVPLSCPTSNCSWPIYETLAVCSKCEEVSDLIDVTFACLYTTVDWSSKWLGPLPKDPYPNGTVCGHFLNVTADVPILLSGYYVNETGGGDNDEALLFRTIPLTQFLTKERLYGVGSVAFKDLRNPILDALISSAVDGLESVYQNRTPTVHECVLLWCVQTIESSYDLGTYREEVLSSYYNTTIGPSPWISWEIPKEEGGGTFVVYTEDITIKNPKTSSDYTNSTVFDHEYGANNVTASNFLAIFDDFFPVTYTVDNISATPRLRYKNYDDGPCQRYLTWSPWLAPNNLTHHLERLATAMTNKVRSLATSSQMLNGEAFYAEKYVLIQWEWLIFPLLLLVLSLVFLVSTIIKTSKDPATGIWKTSAMPTLIYGLPKEIRSKLNPASSWDSAHESSKKVRIKLLPNMGWRVSGASHLSTSPQLPRPAVQAPCGWI
jgi:hypothetical protein